MVLALRFFGVLDVWTVQAITTYRVYRLYSKNVSMIVQGLA